MVSITGKRKDQTRVLKLVLSTTQDDELGQWILGAIRCLTNSAVMSQTQRDLIDMMLSEIKVVPDNEKYF